MKTGKFYLPISGDMILVLGPAEYPGEPGRLPDPSCFKAFRVCEDESVILKPGVWHWVPFPVSDPITMYVVFANMIGEEDNVIVEFSGGVTLNFCL
jgi:ureidoglycolate hydrolase